MFRVRYAIWWLDRVNPYFNMNSQIFNNIWQIIGDKYINVCVWSQFRGVSMWKLIKIIESKLIKAFFFFNSRVLPLSDRILYVSVLTFLSIQALENFYIVCILYEKRRWWNAIRINKNKFSVSLRKSYSVEVRAADTFYYMRMNRTLSNPLYVWIHLINVGSVLRFIKKQQITNIL